MERGREAIIRVEKGEQNIKVKPEHRSYIEANTVSSSIKSEDSLEG